MSLPQSMNHIAVAKPGGPEVLQLATGPVPQCKPHEVLISVEATGVNRPDVQQRKGVYPPPPDASPLLGLEVAGVIAAIGADVKSLHVGDRVCALTNGGAYAEYCTAPDTQCLPWPSGFGAIEAASIPETFFTVWANVFMIGHLAAGETILVHGGSSGIGLTAIQLAAAFGATVIATAGSPEKCKACLDYGAAHAIDYKQADFAAEVKSLTGGKGVNLILDMVGAAYTMRNIRSLALEGRLVQIALMEGAIVQDFDLTPIMVKRLTLTGSTMRPRTAAQKGEIARQLREKVWPLLESGKVKPTIHGIFPLAEAAEAHRLMESSTHIGKIVLAVKPHTH